MMRYEQQWDQDLSGQPRLQRHRSIVAQRYAITHLILSPDSPSTLAGPLSTQLNSPIQHLLRPSLGQVLVDEPTLERLGAWKSLALQDDAVAQRG